MTTHYDVLGVDADATFPEIKRAYYRRARAYHPDAHAGSPVALLNEAERAMQSLNVAWNVLRNPRTRATYDRLLEIREEVPSKRRRAPSRRRAADEQPARLAIGSGFQYWLGSAGSAGKRSDGAARLNLSVDGATSLEPLRALAPDGLVGLHAENSAVDDAELIHLQGITGLMVLDLSATRVTDAGLVHLQSLTRLETLVLWETAITDTGMALIGRLASLRHLGIGNTAVTDAGLASLAALQRLRLLQLWGTNIQGPGLRHLASLPELESVTLPFRVQRRYRRELKAALPNLVVL